MSNQNEVEELDEKLKYITILRIDSWEFENKPMAWADAYAEEKVRSARIDELEHTEEKAS